MKLRFLKIQLMNAACILSRLHLAGTCPQRSWRKISGWAVS
jgi:hypothetical protein